MSVFHSYILPWIDFIWLPLAFFIVHKHQRWLALGFVFCCIFSLRLQTELLEAFGLDNGATGWVDTSAYVRGLITYSVFYVLYFLLSHYSPGTRQIVYLAASLSIYMIAFAVSMVVMAI